MRTCPQAQRSRSADMLTWCATPHRFGSMYRLSSVSNGRSVLCGGLMASCEQVCCVRWGACSYRVPTAQRAVGVWCTPQIVVPTWIMSSLGLTDSAAAAARTDDDTAVSLLPKVAIERVELDTLFKVRVSVAGEHGAHLSYVRPLRGWLWVTCVLRHPGGVSTGVRELGIHRRPKEVLGTVHAAVRVHVTGATGGVCKPNLRQSALLLASARNHAALSGAHGHGNAGGARVHPLH